MKFFQSINQGCLAYASTSFASAMLNSIFMFYYVKIFINIYQVSNYWFQISQVFFMIWNTFNDPLFGYMQDNFNWKCFKNRRLSVLYGAPLYALAFLLPWFPWDNYEPGSWLCGMHLMFSLFWYDALFTFVLLAHCCLFAEMSTSYTDRLNMKWCSVIASLCAFWAVPMCNYLSDNMTNLPVFRLYNVGISMLACCAMIYTGRNAHTVYEKIAAAKGTVKSKQDSTKPVDWVKTYQGSPVKLTLQILCDRDFEAFVWTNFCHIFHSVFLSNFTAIFVDNLSPISTFQKTIFFSLLFTLPQLVIILGKNWILHLGYYRVIMSSIIFTIAMSVTVYFFSPGPHGYLLFILVDTVVVHATFSLFDLVLSDISDKDKEKHSRSHPISSMVFGTNALITKPAISFAPMIGVAVLNFYGYQKLLHPTNTFPLVAGQLSAAKLNPSDKLSWDELTDLKGIMFTLSCGVPFCMGVIQLFIWSFYSMRSSHRTNLSEEKNMEILLNC